MKQSLDTRISRFIFEKTKESWALRHLAVFLADDLLWLLVGLFFGMAAWGGTPELREFLIPAAFLGVSLFGPWFVTLGISKLVLRPRPYVKQNYTPIIRPFIETSSFPSAHATFAFALAALAYDGTQIFYYFLIGACLIALGRVAVGVHYVKDVLAGAFVGLLFSKAVQIAILLLVAVIN